jgi:radical SAM protein with 4Fe4S-binding SPASM domain
MNMLVAFKQKLSNSKIFNWLEQKFVRQFLSLRPLRHIMIEPTNLCNLQCLFCTQAESLRPKGRMLFEEFNKILQKLPSSVREVQLHFAGESALNRDLPLMISALKNRNIKTALSTNCTLSFDYYRNIIEAGLDQLIISFDGATKEVYETYRRGGNFENVIQNIKQMSVLAGRKTKLIIQFIVMRHNEHQIELMKKLADELGVDEIWLKSASLNIGCSEILEKEIINNAKNFLPQNPKYSRYEFKDGKLVNKDRPLSCPWIFRSVILWNGDITICCVDLEGQAVVGNIFRERSLNDIWQSQKYNQVRKLVLQRELAICKNCSIGDNPIKEIIKFGK